MYNLYLFLLEISNFIEYTVDLDIIVSVERNCNYMLYKIGSQLYELCSTAIRSNKVL